MGDNRVMFGEKQNIIGRFAATVAAYRKASRGAVSVELAFFTVVAVAMIAGAIEFGRLGLEQVRIASAARAGAQYGIYDLSTAGDIDGITEAARIDADDVTNSLTVQAAQYCRCPDGTVQACTLSCSDGEYAPLYVEVQVSEEVDLWFSFPGVPSSITLAARSNMRVR